MTATTIVIDSDTTTLAELCEALDNARATEKRLILKSDAVNMPGVRAKIAELIRRVEAELDREHEPAPRIDAATYPGDWMPTVDTTNPEDLRHGFHVTRHGRNR